MTRAATRWEAVPLSLAKARQAEQPEMADQLASQICERYSDLKAKRIPWEMLWRELADYIMPRKFGTTMLKLTPNATRESRLYDTTAIYANNVLASGQMAWITPQSGDWFVLQAPPELERSENCKAYFAECTKRIRTILSDRSNFYTVIHEFYSDRSAFGTAALHVEPGKKYALNFRVFPLGSFAIDEDDEGNVDSVYREFELTARQAAQQFGKENLPECIQQALDKGGVSLGQKFTFCHGVYPRPEELIDPNGVGPLNMHIASVYVELSSKRIVSHGGYESMPTMVSRYLEWSNGLGGIYGWSPAWAALPEARQLNLLQMWLDAMAHKNAIPPTVEPASMEGELDLSAGARNPVDDDLFKQGMIPKPLHVVGDFDSALQRIQERQSAIRRHFHVDLFEMFGAQSKEMTATEVNARLREKVVQITPSFARLTTELLNPLIRRVYELCLDAGLLPPIPEELVVPVSETQGVVVPPSVTYASRMEVELRQSSNMAFEKLMQDVSLLAPISPDVVDNFDADAIARDHARTYGLPNGQMKKPEEVKAMRQARAQAAQQQQQMEMMEKGAKMVGAIKPEMLQAAQSMTATT